MPGTRPGMTRIGEARHKRTMTEARPLRSYGRRKGKPLSARKERLISDLLPKLRLDVNVPAPKRLQDLFRVPVREVWLEIGFGSGEHLLFQAEHHKDVGFIGCEPFINGVASLLGEIETRGLRTVRVYDGDARDVLAWLPDSAVSRLFILFPDPWPKKRHLKRRLISTEMSGEFGRVLAPSGELRFASDSGDYAAHALDSIGRSRDFMWLAERPSDWRVRPPDWPETRYERKALSEGRKPVYLRFKRV
jgi:tRNA (guanine-N7-)-methyltransferase